MAKGKRNHKHKGNKERDHAEDHVENGNQNQNQQVDEQQNQQPAKVAPDDLRAQVVNALASADAGGDVRDAEVLSEGAFPADQSETAETVYEDIPTGYTSANNDGEDFTGANDDLDNEWDDSKTLVVPEEYNGENGAAEQVWDERAPSNDSEQQLTDAEQQVQFICKRDEPWSAFQGPDPEDADFVQDEPQVSENVHFNASEQQNWQADNFTKHEQVWIGESIDTSYARFDSVEEHVERIDHVLEQSTTARIPDIVPDEGQLPVDDFAPVQLDQSFENPAENREEDLKTGVELEEDVTTGVELEDPSFEPQETVHRLESIEEVDPEASVVYPPIEHDDVFRENDETVAPEIYQLEGDEQLAEDGVVIEERHLDDFQTESEGAAVDDAAWNAGFNQSGAPELIEVVEEFDVSVEVVEAQEQIPTEEAEQEVKDEIPVENVVEIAQEPEIQEEAVQIVDNAGEEPVQLIQHVADEAPNDPAPPFVQKDSQDDITTVPDVIPTEIDNSGGQVDVNNSPPKEFEDQHDHEDNLKTAIEVDDVKGFYCEGTGFQHPSHEDHLVHASTEPEIYQLEGDENVQDYDIIGDTGSQHENHEQQLQAPKQHHSNVDEMVDERDVPPYDENANTQDDVFGPDDTPEVYQLENDEHVEDYGVVVAELTEHLDPNDSTHAADGFKYMDETGEIHDEQLTSTVGHALISPEEQVHVTRSRQSSMCKTPTEPEETETPALGFHSAFNKFRTLTDSSAPVTPKSQTFANSKEKDDNMAYMHFKKVDKGFFDDEETDEFPATPFKRNDPARQSRAVYHSSPEKSIAPVPSGLVTPSADISQRGEQREQRSITPVKSEQFDRRGRGRVSVVRRNLNERKGLKNLVSLFESLTETQYDAATNSVNLSFTSTTSSSAREQNGGGRRSPNTNNNGNNANVLSSPEKAVKKQDAGVGEPKRTPMMPAPFTPVLKSPTTPVDERLPSLSKEEVKFSKHMPSAYDHNVKTGEEVNVLSQPSPSEWRGGNIFNFGKDFTHSTPFENLNSSKRRAPPPPETSTPADVSLSSETPKRSTFARPRGNSNRFRESMTSMKSYGFVPPPMFKDESEQCPAGTVIESRKRIPFSTESFRDAIIYAAERRGSNTPGTPASVKQWMAHNNLNDSFVSFETTPNFLTEEEFYKFLTLVAKKLEIETNRVEEAKRTVNYWRNRPVQNGSLNEICAHALLLIALKRVNIFRELATRIDTFQRMKIGPAPLCPAARTTVKISNIRFTLAPPHFNPFQDDQAYIFLVVASSNERVMASKIVQVLHNRKHSSQEIRIEDDITFKNLPLHFQIRLEIFGMRYNPGTKSPFKKVVNTLIGKSSTDVISSPQALVSNADGELQDTTTPCLFQLHGFLPVNRYTPHSASNTLIDYEYPLEGPIAFNYRVSSLPQELTVGTVGFWNVLGNGERVVYWVNMVDGVIFFFNSAEDAKDKSLAVYCLELSSICTPVIQRTVLPEDDVYSQHAFLMTVLYFPRDGEDVTHNQLAVGFENDNLLDTWLAALNESLNIVRGYSNEE